MNSNTDYLEFDLFRLIKALWNKAWLIIVSAFLCGAMAFSYANFMITPLYNSSVLMYVNNSSFSLGNTNFSFSSSELTAAQSLVDTYIVILKTRTTLESVISQAELNYSYEDLVDMIDARAVDGTEVFEITVTSKYPQEAEKIANTIARVLPNKVAAVVDGSSVRVVDYAVVADKKASPNITMYTALGILLGLAASCTLIVILEVLDDQIRDEDYLLQTYDVPILASIPNLMRSSKTSYNYSSQHTEKK